MDDGSTDDTRKVAEEAGAQVVSFRRNRGLAFAFQQGLNTALEMGADVIVNIDADGQYEGSEIPNLIKPVIGGQADVVLTDRRVWSLNHMPFSKKVGNTIATWVTCIASEYSVLDGQSGFRAFSWRDALACSTLPTYYPPCP